MARKDLKSISAAELSEELDRRRRGLEEKRARLQRELDAVESELSSISLPSTGGDNRGRRARHADRPAAPPRRVDGRKKNASARQSPSSGNARDQGGDARDPKWSKVDWSQSNAEIARQLGVSRQRVHQIRQQAGA